MDLSNDDDRKRASEIIRECATLSIYTEEPISIIKNRADFLIKKANGYLHELQYLKSISNDNKVKFYNWLEER